MFPVEQHPVTGHRLVGTQLPLWGEAVALALAAHGAFPQFPSIGWDIAIAPDGPILIEGNVGWSARLAQHALGCPLGATRLSECYPSWAEHVSRSGSKLIQV